jgi:hypothetical protein
MPAGGQHNLASRFQHLKPMKKMKRGGLQERSEVTISPGLERLLRPAK